MKRNCEILFAVGALVGTIAARFVDPSNWCPQTACVLLSCAGAQSRGQRFARRQIAFHNGIERSSKNLLVASSPSVSPRRESSEVARAAAERKVGEGHPELHVLVACPKGEREHAFAEGPTAIRKMGTGERSASPTS